MYFNSMQYLIFFLVVALVYYMLPKKIRFLWLLAASYYFYMNWNAEYAMLILGVSLISYASALALNRLTAERTRRAALTVCLLSCFGLLIYFKYANFLLANLNGLLRIAGADFRFSALDILLPVGISFYIFQAVGYVIDVYRGDIAAEKNPFRYLLFVSFFPQLVAGPIERSKNLLHQLRSPKPLTGELLRQGLIFILIGLWQKVLIADNLAAIIDPIFEDYTSYPGCSIALATILFGVQIYCDFGGYSNIAIGSAKLLGVDLMTNFSSPYLAVSVPDFWRRWHISLTSWFRDYLYIPLGGNRKGKARKHLNTLLVFFVSGAWHGAAWNYIFWGTLNGLMITASDWKSRLLPKKETGRPAALWRKRLLTFLLIDITWFFFRAPSLSEAFRILGHSLEHPGISAILSGNVFRCFGSLQTLAVLLLSVGLLLLIDTVKEKNGGFISALSSRNAVCRWLFYIVLVLMIIIFGAYGEGYEQTEFIYFQF